MTTHKLVLPADFQDYAYEVEAKGWFAGASLQYKHRQFPLTFYDPTRLKQTIADELRDSPVFSEPNLLVVASVTESAMRNAVDHAVETGLVEAFFST